MLYSLSVYRYIYSNNYNECVSLPECFIPRIAQSVIANHLIYYRMTKCALFFIHL